MSSFFPPSTSNACVLLLARQGQHFFRFLLNNNGQSNQNAVHQPPIRVRWLSPEVPRCVVIEITGITRKNYILVNGRFTCRKPENYWKTLDLSLLICSMKFAGIINTKGQRFFRTPPANQSARTLSGNTAVTASQSDAPLPSGQSSSTNGVDVTAEVNTFNKVYREVAF